jgi:hypothetical protein
MSWQNEVRWKSCPTFSGADGGYPTSLHRRDRYMNEEFSDLRIHDPKIVPPPDECVLVEFESSPKERLELQEAAKEADC